MLEAHPVDALVNGRDELDVRYRSPVEDLHGLMLLLPTPRIGRSCLNCEVDKQNHDPDGGNQECERHKPVVGSGRRDCIPGRVMPVRLVVSLRPSH